MSCVADLQRFPVQIRATAPGAAVYNIIAKKAEFLLVNLILMSSEYISTYLLIDSGGFCWVASPEPF
jgi:hypothetical protein